MRLTREPAGRTATGALARSRKAGVSISRSWRACWTLSRASRGPRGGWGPDSPRDAVRPPHSQRGTTTWRTLRLGCSRQRPSLDTAPEAVGRPAASINSPSGRQSRRQRCATASDAETGDCADLGDGRTRHATVPAGRTERAGVPRRETGPRLAARRRRPAASQHRALASRMCRFCCSRQRRSLDVHPSGYVGRTQASSEDGAFAVVAPDRLERLDDLALGGVGASGLDQRGHQVRPLLSGGLLEP